MVTERPKRSLKPSSVEFNLANLDTLERHILFDNAFADPDLYRQTLSQRRGFGQPSYLYGQRQFPLYSNAPRMMSSEFGDDDSDNDDLDNFEI